MSSGDFLCKEAQTPLTGSYVMAGALCSISTNSESILAAARDCSCPAEVPTSKLELQLRFWVDPNGTTQPPWPRPHFRGLDHLVYGGFDAQNSLLMDLRRRCAIGRFSPAMGADREWWQTVIFPSLVTVLGAAIGVTPLHCACVVRNKSGLVLAGLSGSGKSTLAFTLARNGFDFLSEDWTYFSRGDGKLIAWGLPARLKLLPDVAEFFSELKCTEPVAALNGERAYLVDPDTQNGIRRSRLCKPQWILFLERQPTQMFRMSRMPSREAAARLERDLLAENPVVEKAQRAVVAHLVDRECWRLEFGGPPEPTARALRFFCECYEPEKSLSGREGQ